MAIRYNGNPAIVLEVQHRTPGNLRAFVQAIIRYINTGKSADVRFSSTEKVELVDVSRHQLEFSYSDPQGYHFIDPDTYDTITLQNELVADAKDYLVENLKVEVLSIGDGRPRSNFHRPLRSRSPNPPRVSGATAPTTCKSQPPSKPARLSRYRFSSRRASRSRSTRAPASTWAGHRRNVEATSEKWDSPTCSSL